MSNKHCLNLTFPWGRSEVVNYILALTMEAGLFHIDNLKYNQSVMICS